MSPFPTGEGPRRPGGRDRRDVVAVGASAGRRARARCARRRARHRPVPRGAARHRRPSADGRRRSSPCVTTMCGAWRWRLVARRLGADLTLTGALASCYRAQFLNVTLPGGVLGDVGRGVQHGRVGRRRRPRAAWRRVGAHGRPGRARRAHRRRPARSPARSTCPGSAARRRPWSASCSSPRPSPSSSSPGSAGTGPPGGCTSWPPTCARCGTARRPSGIVVASVLAVGRAPRHVRARRPHGRGAHPGDRAAAPGPGRAPGVGRAPQPRRAGARARAPRRGPSRPPGWARHPVWPRPSRSGPSPSSAPCPAPRCCSPAGCVGSRPERAGRRRRRSAGRRGWMPWAVGRVAERPYTLLSCAVSLDGCLDDTTDQRLVLSNEADLDRVDAVRASCDAILVGAGTVRADDPRLAVRDADRRARRVAEGRSPTPRKVTLTRHPGLDPNAAMFAGGDGDPLVYCATPAVAATRERLGGHRDGRRRRRRPAGRLGQRRPRRARGAAAHGRGRAGTC